MMERDGVQDPIELFICGYQAINSIDKNRLPHINTTYITLI